MNKFLRLSGEVKAALTSPTSAASLSSRLVLLESTILTHGMPYPENLNMAKAVQEIIRERGAIPATVGLLSGHIHVGLSDAQLERLCRPSKGRLKISRRDFGPALASGCDGGTTVSGTLAVASHLGWPPLFVTGGVGGVHRGAENSMDVSADLVELGRARTAVLSAGVKSILDIGKTLEYLETQGVCVATIGPTTDFPAFFTAKSGFHSPHCVQDVDAAAELIRHQREFDLDSGILLANPIPSNAAAEGEMIERAIQSALRAAEEEGVAGNEVTPFVLKRVNELTKGQSLQANLSLIKHNADVGAQIAVRLSEKLKRKVVSKSKGLRPVVIGGSIFDLVTSVEQTPIELNGSTHRGRVHFGLGGVGRNLADALVRFDRNPAFVSAVGNDDLGRDILTKNSALDTTHVSVLEDANTAMYNVILDGVGEAQLGVGDMSIHTRIDPEMIESKRDLIRNEASMVILDGNVTQAAFDAALRTCLESDAPLFFEPTDLHFAHKLTAAGDLAAAITYTSPNFGELAAMSPLKKPNLDSSMAKTDLEGFLKESTELCLPILKHVQVITMTLGSLGLLLVRRGARSDPLPLKNDRTVITDLTDVSSTFYPVQALDRVVSVSGAGDCFTAAFISSALGGRGQDAAVAAGIQAARVTLRHHKSVPEELCSEVIDWEKKADGREIKL